MAQENVVIKASRPVPGLQERIAQLEQRFDRADSRALTRTVERGIKRIMDRSKSIRPGFSYSWVAPEVPDGAEKIAGHTVGESAVTIYTVPDQVDGLYHVQPYEYALAPEEATLVDSARAVLVEQEAPRFGTLTQARSYVRKRGSEALARLSASSGVTLGKGSSGEIETRAMLADVLARYTAGFGVAEVFLADPYVQDIYVDAPAHRNPVHLTLNHPDAHVPEKCVTNVKLGGEDAESLLSRFRYESGRPFSEAMPYLECDLDEYNTRVTVIGSPLSPDGVAVALRRHSTVPWTLAKLASLKSLTPEAAGFLSFLIDGRSTVLVAGGRGAGKTSLLGALVLEFPQSQRILTIEDTLELPVREMQALGYKVQAMQVKSSVGGIGELSADEALRISLRLGESAIVLGEVRGQEARTLYEAMRTGTAGSSVLGTIHGASAKAVYERVVHDLGIPAKAFSATDIVVVAGLRRPFGGQRHVRRVVEISELDKDSMTFNPLMLYSEKSDELEATDHLLTSHKLGEIAGAWGLSNEEALDNIRARSDIRKELLDAAASKQGVLGPEWTAKANNAFWNLVDKHGKDYSAIVDAWKKWFSSALRRHS